MRKIELARLYGFERADKFKNFLLKKKGFIEALERIEDNCFTKDIYRKNVRGDELALIEKEFRIPDYFKDVRNKKRKKEDV